jgi:hypothetical protein
LIDAIDDYGSYANVVADRRGRSVAGAGCLPGAARSGIGRGVSVVT